MPARKRKKGRHTVAASFEGNRADVMAVKFIAKQRGMTTGEYLRRLVEADNSVSSEIQGLTVWQAAQKKFENCV